MISILKKTVGFVTLLALAGGCRAPETNDAIVVVASFFPIAEVASDLVTDDNVHVVNITPPGLEPHDVELTTQNLDELLDASLVLYIGGGFQPAIDDAVSRADGDVVDLSDGADDPHIWLDPVAWTTAVGKIADAIKSLGGGGAAELYATVARELADLDESFDAGLADCERDLVVTAHDAFGRLADRYGLGVESIAGISPEAEPNPKRLAELADLAKREGVTTIFTEELVSPEVAEALADDVGVRTAVLDPIENEPEGGYFGAMERNLAELQKALGCR